MRKLTLAIASAVILCAAPLEAQLCQRIVGNPMTRQFDCIGVSIAAGAGMANTVVKFGARNTLVLCSLNNFTICSSGPHRPQQLSARLGIVNKVRDRTLAVRS